MDSRKQDIIMEIGSQWIRVGLISDKVPRKTFSASVLNAYKNKNPQISLKDYEISIQQTLFSVFFSYINCSCLNKTVVIVEKVYTQRIIVQTIAMVLFKKFKIQKLQFALSCVTPLYLTGRFSGIVVSAGASCAQIMPVFSSYPLFRAFKYISTGSKAMINHIKDQLILQNPQTKQQVFAKMTDEYFSQVQNQYSNMKMVKEKSEEVVNLVFKKSRLKLKPSNLTYSNLFGDHQAEGQYNIAWSFLQALNQVPIENLESICSNVVLAGGLWRVKGMQMFFKDAIVNLLPNFEKLQKLKVKEKIKFVSWNFNPSDVSWIGCSVGSSIKCVDAMCLKRIDYEKSGFTEKVMQNYFLSE